MFVGQVTVVKIENDESTFEGSFEDEESIDEESFDEESFDEKEA